MQPALGIEAEVPATKHSATQRSEDLQRKARPLQRERPTPALFRCGKGRH